MNTRQLARRTDPDTSHIAAEFTGEFSYDHCAAVVEALAVHGPMGKDGIAHAAGLDGVQVARRLPELQRANVIEPTGRKVDSDQGRPEREWRVREVSQ